MILRRSLWTIYLKSKSVKPLWQETDKFQILDPQSARNQLSHLLLAQLKYFGFRADALPEWREAAAVSDPGKLWEIWPSLPVLTKADLQTRFDPQEIRSRFGVTGIISSTGGSTGEPTPYLHDPRMIYATTASRLYCRYKFGWRPGMPTIKLWGSERDIGKQTTWTGKLRSFLRNDWLIDSYRLDDRIVDKLLFLLDKHAPAAVYGFTSILDFVANQIIERGVEIPPGAVLTAWNGGEMLFESHIERFRRAFGVPILNLYGGRELSAMAYQPTESAPLRVLRPHLFLEIVDDNGKPTPPGKPGRLLWTSTVCRGTPFLRYDIGDVGAYDARGFDESGIFEISALHGRRAGLLQIGDKTISALYWNHLFKGFPEVRQFQVVILGHDALHFRLVGSGFSSERKGELLETVTTFLGPVSIGIQWMDRLPLTPQGKLVQVIHE